MPARMAATSGGLPGHHLGDLVDGVDLVAGIDALGRIAEEEILAAGQAGQLLQQRTADVFGHARIDGAFVDHDRTRRRLGFQRLADRARGRAHRTEIGSVLVVHRCRDGDNVDGMAGQIGSLGAELQGGAAQDLRLDFPGAVLAAAKLVHPAAVDIEAQNREMPGQGNSQRQADIAKANDGNRRGGCGLGQRRVFRLKRPVGGSRPARNCQ
jgi:hypothetical protein